MKSFKTVITILMLGFSEVDMKNTPRKVEFESDDCSESLIFNLVGFEQGQNITDKLNSTDQQIFYFPTPTKISMECYAKFPVEIQVEREMPSLVENVRIERHVTDVLNTESYCYRILFNLPEDYKVTGKYTCKGIIHITRTSSIFIFYGKDGGTELLNSGSTKSIPGLPDDTGWITIPCIGTNPFKKPVLYMKPELRTDRVIRVNENETTSVVRYIPTRGFLVNASWDKCCNQLYFCNITGTIGGTLTINLLTGFTNKLHLRASKLKPGETSSTITLRGPQKILVFCESNEPVELHSSHQNFSHGSLTENNRKSFYQYRSTLMGTLNAGTLDISCHQQNTNNLIYEWKYTIRAVSVQEPGIHLNKNNPEYPFKCYGEANKDVVIYNIQCDDFINCQIAGKFSYLANEPISSIEVYPFSVTSGSKCNVGNCAQIHHKPSKKQGIIRCIERNDKRTTYNQRYVYGLSGKNIIEHYDWPTEEMLRMESITRTLYLDEIITFRCEAASVFFALGIQLVFTLEDKTLLTKSNLNFFNFNEGVRDGKITLEVNVTITDFSIKKVSCHAPYWNTEGWKIVSQPLNIEIGQRPSISQDTPSLFVFSLSDVNKVIECEAWGDPKPTITWTKDNDALSNSENKHFTEIGNTSSIVLRRVREAHFGTYLCFAQNVRGNASRRFVVKLAVNDHSKDLIIYGSVVGSFFVFFTVILLILIKKLRNNRDKLQLLTDREIDEFVNGNVDAINPELDIAEQAHLLPYDTTFEFPLSKLRFYTQLGAGAYGTVMKALAAGICKHEAITTVAVKTIHPNADVYFKALLSEIKIMIHIGQHPNVVSLLGAVTKTLSIRKVYLIVEYCRYGNLQMYLNKNRKIFVNELRDGQIHPEILTYNTAYLNVTPNPASAPTIGQVSDEDSTVDSSSGSTNRNTDCDSPVWLNVEGDYLDSDVRVLNTSHLMSWSYQIAQGMEYLANKNVIHGDLAARNVLIADNSVIKIADFGLARQVYKDPNYIKSESCPLPVKWMAIESIRSLQFSTKSDVWAFGVVLWEMFTLGDNPYPGISVDAEFLNKLEDGFRMDQPKYSSQEMYDVMLGCWKEDPEGRPSFKNLVQLLRSFLTKAQKEALPAIQIHACTSTRSESAQEVSV